jgi:hypothetical protein
MRVIMAALALSYAAAAVSQAPAPAAGPDAAPPARPVELRPGSGSGALESLDDLAPAVEVGNIISRAEPAGPSERAPARAMDSLDLGTTSITGTQELPKVLYIVPWKKSDLGDLVGRPVNTLLDEVLAPVDPEVFERHLSYYDALYGDSDEE